MSRAIGLCLGVLVVIFALDQAIKMLFISGFRWYGEFFSLILTYNKGVAFSMFAFLAQYLKYLQLVLIGGMAFYLLKHKELLQHHTIAIGLIGGAALSNIFDRFVHGGVVDFFFWHYGFEFAVFNFADVMIDLGVLLIILRSWKSPKTL